jgi:hypothetical protein
MAYNLSSNQQYLLSMVQQNNPEILSKFLNEGRTNRSRIHSNPYHTDISPEQRQIWAERDAAAADAKQKAKDDPFGAIKMGKARRGEFDSDPDTAAEQQSRLKRSDEKYKAIDALKKEHYTDLLQKTANMDPETMDAKTAGELLMYKIESGQTKKTAAERMRDIAMGGALTKSPEQEKREQDLLDATSMSAEPGTFGERFKTMSANEIGSIAARSAKREADKIADNKAISPFYRTTRKQFRDEFGRDFDASGGATPANMRGLVNIKTNLGGRLNDIEAGWQDKMSWEGQLAAGNKHKNLFARMASTLAAKTKAEEDNPVHSYRASDFDVPEVGNPGETEGTGRTLPTKPVDTKRKTEWVFSDQYDLPLTDKTQASNLTGKSVNQKISRIA